MLDIAACLPHCPLPVFCPDVFAWDDDDQAAPARDSKLPTTQHVEAAPSSRAVPSSSASESGLEVDATHCMTLIQRGDEKGLRVLHGLCRHKAFVCALAIVRRDEMAHEIVSTSFMQVWTSAARYDPARGSTIGWLLMIVRSRSLDALRSANLIWQREISPEHEDSLEGDASDEMSGPPARLEQQDRGRRVQRALLRLSPIQRQALTLTALDGLSHDEASRHLELPLGTLKSHVRRGLAAMRLRCDAIGLTVD